MNYDINLDEEKDKELSEIKKIVEQNNKMLHSLQNRARFGTIFSVLKWVIVVGISIGAYAFLQPYLNILLDTYTSIQESTSAIDQLKNSIPDTSKFDLSKLLK